MRDPLRPVDKESHINVPVQARAACGASPCNRGLAEQLIVVSVSADPEPHETISAFHSHCAIATSHARGPEATDFLEMKRWVLWILLEMFVGLIRELPDVLRQRPVTDPEVRGRMMFQRGVVFPAA